MSAERATIIDLLDAAERVSGAQLAIFEREHPEAPKAFEMWCEGSGYRSERVDVGPYAVLRCALESGAPVPPAITIYLRGAI